MSKTCLIAAVVALVTAPALAAPVQSAAVPVSTQQEGPGRGDDLQRITAWRAFLDRADRAFFAARMNTAGVRAKIAEADERIKELEEAARSSEPDPGGRSDITGDISFLEQAHRAFTAAHMNTADVQKWLREARDKGRQDALRAAAGSHRWRG